MVSDGARVRLTAAPATTYRRGKDYFGVAGVAPASDLGLLADISKFESAGLPPAAPERAISSYAYMTSQAWRLPVPHIQTAS